jgi:Protein of unknown function (DUF1571)
MQFHHLRRSSIAALSSVTLSSVTLSSVIAAVASIACQLAVAQDHTTEPVYRVANEAAANTVAAAPAPVAAPAAAPAAPFDLTQQPGEHPMAPAIRVMKEVLANIDQNVRDYTCTLVKREAVEGVLGDQQQIMLKVRQSPFSAYLYFLKPFQGREVLFVDGVNDNNLVVLEAGWKRNLGKMNLDPNGMVAMRGQKHPITDVGIRNLMAKLIAAKTAEMQFMECTVTSNPNTRIGDRATTMIQIEHPVPRKEFGTHITRLFLDNELRVPIHYDAYLWPEAPGQAPPLDASYTYANLKLNVGLAARDFDATNPELFK